MLRGTKLRSGNQVVKKKSRSSDTHIGERSQSDIALATKPLQREVAPDRRQEVCAKAVGYGDGEGGGFIDSYRDHAGGETSLRRANAARRRKQAGQRHGRHVDHE